VLTEHTVGIQKHLRPIGLTRVENIHLVLFSFAPPYAWLLIRINPDEPSFWRHFSVSAAISKQIRGSRSVPPTLSTSLAAAREDDRELACQDMTQACSN